MARARRLQWLLLPAENVGGVAEEQEQLSVGVRQWPFFKAELSLLLGPPNVVT
jgi:hypothetical protein